MKGKTKQQKGITLIALIITIVVLLILAAVAISSITNDGILQYAANATTSWNQAQVNESEILGGYVNYLENGGSSANKGETIPEGGTYYVGVTSTTQGDYTGATVTYMAGESFPETVTSGDVYVYGDYEYRYNMVGSTAMNWATLTSNFCWKEDTTQNGWGIRCINNVSQMGSVLKSINGQPLTSMTYTFYNCSSLTAAPTIPDSVTNLDSTFYSCIALTTVPIIPESVTSMSGTFVFCVSLTRINMPCSLASKNYTYSNGPAAITYYHITDCDGSCGK